VQRFGGKFSLRLQGVKYVKQPTSKKQEASSLSCSSHSKLKMEAIECSMFVTVYHNTRRDISYHIAQTIVLVTGRNLLLLDGGDCANTEGFLNTVNKSCGHDRQRSVPKGVSF
jgi:hypothetical protein